MLRKDRECNEPALYDEVFSKAEIMFLAFNDGEYPYCIPVNFAREQTRLYIHSALAGHKLDILQQNDKVAFSAAIDVEIDVRRSTTYYKSVCGKGRGAIVQDESEKQKALDLIATRYNAACPKPAPLAAINRVTIIRIEIESLNGKCNLRKP